MRVRYTATALAEAEAILSYIAERNSSAAAAVRERIERTIATLAVVPEMAQLTDEPGVRRMPLRSYPYLIFYTVDDDELVILHVRHGARRLPWEADE
jgi:plasmid stabilization system protein ParE